MDLLMGLMVFLTTWSDLAAPFDTLAGDLIGSPLLIGGIVVIFISFFAMLLALPFEAMVVVWIPTGFLAIAFIPELRIVMGICLGFIIGIGLVKWVRR
jgi:hypothetical protein